MSDAFKREILARMKATGERYTQARRALLTQREASSPATTATAPAGEGERRDETRPNLEGAPNGR